MLTRMLRLARVGLAVGILASATPAQASSLVLDVQSGSTFARGSFANFGYTVTFNQLVRVDALGLWDYQANGLVDAHQVGVWDAAGTLLAQAVVDNGSTVVASVDAQNAWLFTDIAPLLLMPGTYKLGAYYPTNGDRFISSLDVPPAQILVNPLATYGNSFATDGTIQFFAEPSNMGPSTWDPGFFGPNAQVSAVPEPGTLALIGAGLGLVLARQRMKRTR